MGVKEENFNIMGFTEKGGVTKIQYIGGIA